VRVWAASAAERSAHPASVFEAGDRAFAVAANPDVIGERQMSYVSWFGHYASAGHTPLNAISKLVQPLDEHSVAFRLSEFHAQADAARLAIADRGYANGIAVGCQTQALKSADNNDSGGG
jgi:hypothetical protein